MQTQSELRGVLLALDEERRSLTARKEKLNRFQGRLAEQREAVQEERKTILEAVAKLGWAEKKFAAKMKEFESIAGVIL